jgi:alginate O-acetyltransferase complex protein AlgI
MVFSSFFFIFLFLPVTLLSYWLAPKSFKNLVLLCASLFFYAWGAPEVVLILFVSSLVDFVLTKQKNFLSNKWYLVFGIVFNLSILFYFKYTNFFLDQVNVLKDGLGLVPFEWTRIILPAGVSFFTFEKISYLIDVFKRTAPPAAKFTDYLLFVSLFPHLIAGPILKYHDLASQIRERTSSSDDFYEGWTRFCFGLGKKILIADEVGRIANSIFALQPTELTMPYAWLGVLAYTFQIYFDFSGYSDMAIGLARMFGFRFIENFNMPYLSQSISEFWRRWHISLGNWMKEYLYIPLGGNRVSLGRSYINLVIVFTLSGFWHGASWAFVAWGLWHGLFLVLDRVFLNKITERLPRIVNVLFTFFLVVIGWVLFRSPSFEQAVGIYAQMFNFDSFFSQMPNYYEAEIINTKGWMLFALAGIITFAPLSSAISSFLSNLWTRFPAKLVFRSVAALILLMLSVVSMAESGFSPFLYYQF